eukprot:COSAG01_NODE_2029_length_8590_cov_5.719501_14_plen_154_part_00
MATAATARTTARPVALHRQPTDYADAGVLSPVEDACFLSRWSFEFTRPLLRVGAAKAAEGGALGFGDLPPLPAHDHAWTVGGQAQAEWDVELATAAVAAHPAGGGGGGRSPSLVRALYRAHRFEFWAAALHAVAGAAAVAPLFGGRFDWDLPA